MNRIHKDSRGRGNREPLKPFEQFKQLKQSKEAATTHAGDRREPQQKLRWKMEEERWKNKALYGWSIVN
jgi:hypothetical protein